MEMLLKSSFGNKAQGRVEVSVDQYTPKEHLVASVSYDTNGYILPNSHRPLSQVFGTREQAIKRFNNALVHGDLFATISNLVIRKEE